MKLRIATIFTLLVSALQWVVISSFVSHSYMWFLKADAPKIDAGIFMTAVCGFGHCCFIRVFVLGLRQIASARIKVSVCSFSVGFIRGVGSVGFLGHGQRRPHLLGESVVCWPNHTFKRTGCARRLT